MQKRKTYRKLKRNRKTMKKRTTGGVKPSNTQSRTDYSKAQSRTDYSNTQSRTDYSNTQSRTGDSTAHSRTGHSNTQSWTGDSKAHYRTGDSKAQSRTGDSTAHSRRDRYKTQSPRVTSSCTPKEKAFTTLASYVRTPHTATLQPYRSAGCDLYIDIYENPHIHVHGYERNTYYYTISGKGIINQPSKLVSEDDVGYKSVLVEMYNALKGTNHKLPAYFSPSRPNISYEDSILEPPRKPPNVGRNSLLSDRFGKTPRSLGPYFRKYASIPSE